MNQKMRTNKMGFEIITCSRCGGSGHYSYCAAHGTRCFKCGGSGVVKSKRGIAAFHYLLKSREINISDLKVGDLIFEYVGMGTKQLWMEVQKIENDKLNKDRVSISCPKCSYGVDSKGRVQMVKDRAHYDKYLEAALEYQTKLTKAGQLMKKHQ